MRVPTMRLAAVVFGALFAAGLGAAGMAVSLDIIDHRPATIINAFNADDVTYRDGNLQIFYDVKKLRDCPTVTTRWLWTWAIYKGETRKIIKPLGVSFSGPTDVGSDQYILSIPVPPETWDGTWYYSTSNISQCGGLLSLLRKQVTEISPIEITIKGTKAHPPRGITPSKAPPKLTSQKKAIIMNGEPLP